MKRKGIDIPDAVCQDMAECVHRLKISGVKLNVMNDKGQKVDKKPSDTSYITKAIVLLNLILSGDTKALRMELCAIRPELFEVPGEEKRVSEQASEQTGPHK